MLLVRRALPPFLMSASLLAAPYARAADIYVTYAADGTPLFTDSPPQNPDARNRSEVYEDLEVWWKDVVPGQYLPNGVPMPNLDRIANLDAWDSEFREAGSRTGLPPELIKAVAVAESHMNPKAVSPAGARGLMQLIPSTARKLGVTDSFDPPQAIAGGAQYLARQVQAFGTYELALAAYNAGPGAVIEHGGIPPFAETRTYVARVIGLYELFRDTRPLSP